MAIPLFAVLALLGIAIGWLIRQLVDTWPTNKPPIIWLFVGITPVLMGFEHFMKRQPTLISGSTSVVINASPQDVWNTVIDFPPIDPPRELLFKLGVAYPTHATLIKNDRQIIRECYFSTGKFVEPITLWDEPRLLSFDVASQSMPMRELSPYDIHPPHLDGALTSKKGQFQIIAVDNNRCRLQGTTWYTINLAPEFYWKLWTDLIIRKIHLRVLNHIKTIAEGEGT